MKPGGFVERDKRDKKTEVKDSVVAQNSPSTSSVSMIPMDQVDAIVTSRIEKALAIQKNERKMKSEDEEDEFIGLNSKTVRGLKEVAQVFTALKEISSNPLQTMIENKVGTMAAGVVEKSFTVPTERPPQDWIDRLLNSQTGAGLGASLGQRGPELVDKLFNLFGKEKTEHWIEGAVASKGGSGGREGSSISGASSPGQQSSEQGQGQSGEQSDVDLIMKLDPNNSEHIVAYAQSQGGIPLDIARKMLIVHQDAFIKGGHGIVGDNGGTETVGHVGQENIQSYKKPGISQQVPLGEQNLDVEEQKVSDDIKAKQVEPDALAISDSLHPQMKLEIVELGQEQEQAQKRPEMEQELQANEILRQLVEMVTNQNTIISQLQSDLNIVKEKDIEKTIKKMEKDDEEIFSSVRKTSNIKIGK